MDVSKIVELARQAALVIEAMTGTNLVEPAIKAGQAILKLVDDAKEVAGASQEELEATRDELEAAVNAHVDSTVARLRGE